VPIARPDGMTKTTRVTAAAAAAAGNERTRTVSEQSERDAYSQALQRDGMGKKEADERAAKVIERAQNRPRSRDMHDPPARKPRGRAAR